ncbi:hypothetical protein BO71DRAFT_489639 [Aspergillus ellipticus CBS 707.79]|uniref:Rhodopsin domain-containing protein n=1 Tax=Aspergillus ellipticus CBS 707.79 TaxID=1448320 RepID=A0A319E8E8_9EURO|nr:hypothetical protein BO71DRAFT_489639 [Aspergillus ellipticus CBS 707.79]
MPQTDSLQTISLVTQILCLVMIAAFVGVRVLVAVRFKKRVDVEDDGAAGGSKPTSSLSPAQINIVYKYYYILTILYVPMVLSVKITLLALLTRLFILRPTQTHILRTILLLTTLYYITILLLKIFICHPIPLFWTNYASDAHCLSKPAVILADAVMSVVTDLAILGLPVWLMGSLGNGVSLRRKVVVSGMLGAGAGLAGAFI